MNYEDVIELRDELVADADKRLKAIEQDKTVLTWVCGICETRNAFWRNSCNLCQAPVHGYIESDTSGVGWPD